MREEEFWCRAFLAAIPPVFQTCAFTGAGGGSVAAQCADMADTALAVAQRRGMVTGERTVPEDRPAGCTCQFVTGLGSPSGPARRALVPTREPCPVHAPDRGRVLERVEFTAERRGAADSGLWALRTATYPDELVVVDGDKPFTLTDGNRIHIKWGESPPKPIEVWLERKGGA